jgi:primosomal protein N'
MIAEVIPVTRLRRATTSWSYLVPAGLKLSVGSLVIIPFRSHPVIGVVWELHERSGKATQQITEVLTATPLVREPSRRWIEWIATYGITSLSTALYTWLPSALRKLPLTKPVRDALLQWDDRTTVATPPVKQHAILVAAAHPQADAALAQKYGTSFHSTFLDTTPAQEFQTWMRIARGELTVVSGRERALAAPWGNLRHLTVIDPEDIGFQTEQIPALSLVTASHTLADFWKASWRARSALPSAVTQLLWPDSLGAIPGALTRTVTDLRYARMLNPELLAALRTCLADKQRAILLLNAHDRAVLQEDGTRLLLPGVEQVTRQLCTALEVPELPALITLGTRSLWRDVPAGPVGLTAMLSIDPLLHAPRLSDQLQGWGDLGKLLRYQAPLIIQTHQPAHPLVSALLQRKEESYYLQTLKQAAAGGLYPFIEEIVITATAEQLETATEVVRELRALLPAEWLVGAPRDATRRRKAILLITLQAPLGTRLPNPAYRYLAQLPRPWQVGRDAWYAG